MPEVKRETPSQRMHYRLNVPIYIDVEGKTFKAADWSMGGFRIDGYDGPLRQGDLFTPEVSIDFRGFHISFRQEAQVVRASEGSLAVSFHDMKPENLELLKYFSEGLLGGEMASFQDAIRRVDMPVTPVEMELVEEATEVPIKRSIRRILIALAYIIIGGALLLYIAITLYSNFWRIEVESGVVCAPTEPLVSPVSGIFEQLIIAPDRSIKLGDPVIRLKNQDNERDYANLQVALNNARFRMYSIAAQLGVDRSTLEIYGKVGDSRLVSARDRVEALKRDVELAQRDVVRKVNLQGKGAVSKEDMEGAQQLAERKQNDLLLAENELRIARIALGGLKRSGLFFSGDRVEGRGHGLKAELLAAQQSVWDLEQQLGGLAGSRANYIIYAPFNGHVVRVLKTPGNTVDRGENLAVLERDDSRYVEVFLTQGESTQVRLGSVAKLFIPSLNIEREGRIIQIDRTRGFVDETDSRYRWRTTVDRTACVTMFFIDKDGKNAQVKDIITGTPVTVSFSRYPTNPIIAGVFNLFRSRRDIDGEKQAAQDAATYEYRSVVRMQGPTSNRTEAGAPMVLVPYGSQTNATSMAPGAGPGNAVAAPLPAKDACAAGQSMLWPGKFFTQIKPDGIPQPLRDQIEAEAKRAAAKTPAPVAVLRSAGATDKEDNVFVASRRAFQDADNAVNLALAYRIMGDKNYQEKALAILTAWAKTNQPTGNPIDETRLDNLVHAYDLLRCELNDAQRQPIKDYFRRMLAAKETWQWGEKTQNNNHRTHQIKMRLLLARALEDGAAFDRAAADAKAHLTANIDASTGETVDYKERSALFYHVYDLEPWMEIVLATGCCKDPVLKAYDFLRDRIAKGETGGEFAKSSAPIDEKRAKAGFAYAKKGGNFDTSRAARTVLEYKTLQGQETTPAMAKIVEGPASSSNLFHLVRQLTWRR